MATPFVQGRLREETLSVIIRTECKHCAESIKIEMDSGLNYKVLEGPTDPLVFVPFVDFDKLAERSIIDAF